MQNSQKTSDKKNIMDYLPQHERAKVRKLVQRLAQETQQKEKFKKLYEQMKEKYEEMNEKYEQLEQHHEELKAQMATSRMALNKAKQAYIASKSAKKFRKVQSEENEEQDKEQQQAKQRERLKQTWLKIPKSAQKNHSSSENSFKKAYIFQQSENNQIQSNYSIAISQKPPLPLKSQQSGMKKTANWRSDKTDISLGSSKKQQIMNLRREIESLTEQMKKKERNGLPLNEKIKKCQEIKSRYLKSKQKDRRKEDEPNSSQQEQQEQQSVESEGQKYSSGKPIKKQASQIKPINLNNKLKAEHNKANKKPQQLLQQEWNGEQQEDNTQVYRTQRKQSQKSRVLSQKQPEKQTSKTTRSKKEPKRSSVQNQYDDSLFAIIDQLNSGN